eukprot:scaffold20759_cov70-Attheya_sp.AAC.4
MVLFFSFYGMIPMLEFCVVETESLDFKEFSRLAVKYHNLHETYATVGSCSVAYCRISTY